MTFEIEALEHDVRLTVVHDGFDPGGAVMKMISGGWPRVISDLKTMVEADAAVAVA